MLRELITNSHKAAETTYSAATAMATGMGVVKNIDGTCSFPSSASCANIFLVDKERVPTGVNAARIDMSDYDAEFNTIAAGDKVKLMQYSAGEKFATSAYASGLTAADAGKTLAVGTDGVWAIATEASIYRFEGFYTDAGSHILAKIAVLDTAIANV